MSQKNEYIENDLNSMKYYSPDGYISNKSYISSFNKNSPISRINNSFTEAINSKYNINNLNEFKSLNKAPSTSDDNYINERYNRVKEENAQLKKSLFELEKSYKVQKGEMEEKILVLRDENSSLQLQIQKTIEKQKNEFKNIDKIYDEKNSLMDENNILKNELNNLKDTITKQNADIEEKNKIINDLQSEKNINIEEEKMYKNQINNLLKDKSILINQMKDLNITISDKISPKLKQNENNLANLKEQIENLRINNEKLKSDNTILFKENKIQKNLIKILTKQNKKLLEEIKYIYDRDILLMNNMEKADNNNTEILKTSINSQNKEILEDEMNVLERSQKYIDDDFNNKKEKNIIEEEKNNLTSLNVDRKFNIIKNILNKENKNGKIINNDIQKNIKIKENNTIIHNDIIIKKNKETASSEDDINSFNNNARNNMSRNINKNLINNNSTEDISNNKNNFTNLKIDLRLKENKLNVKKAEKIEKKLNSKSYTINEEKKYELADRSDDIKVNNISIMSDNKNKGIFSHTMDENLNIKYKFDNINLEQNNKIFSIDGNNESQMNSKINCSNKVIDTYNSNNISSNTLFNSQAKSLLSEYVEDLDVIE